MAGSSDDDDDDDDWAAEVVSIWWEWIRFAFFGLIRIAGVAEVCLNGGVVEMGMGCFFFFFWFGDGWNLCGSGVVVVSKCG